MKIALNYLLFIGWLLVSFVAQGQQVKLDEKDLQADIALLKNALEKAHPGYLRYTDEAHIQGQWQALNARSRQSSGYSQLAFYADVAKLLASLRCEHTKAELPDNLENIKKQRFMPFTFALFNNRMFIEAAAVSGLKRGDEVTQINGIPVRQALTMLAPYIAIDGYTQQTIEGKLAWDGDLLGSGFEQYFAPVVLGLDDYPQRYALTVNTQTGETKQLDALQAIDFTTWRKLSDRAYRMDFKDAITLTMFEQQSTAILRVDTFVNYRNPVDAYEVFNQHFSLLRNKGITQLIVDLRRNGGGSDDAQIALMRHLYNTPFQLVNGAWLSEPDLGELKNRLKSWDDTAIKTNKRQLIKTPQGRQIPIALMGLNGTEQMPADMVFQGEIIVLSSKANASASGALLAHIHQQDNVTVVGEATGGNQGGTTASVIAFLTLPASGITVRVPLIRNRYNIANAQDGLGAIPDVYAEQTYLDWLTGKDPAMLKARDMFGL